jgi:hypothetical protein
MIARAYCTPVLMSLPDASGVTELVQRLGWPILSSYRHTILGKTKGEIGSLIANSQQHEKSAFATNFELPGKKLLDTLART